jgi:prepilin-type N-terminal cleavage/methylation domain-containing protein
MVKSRAGTYRGGYTLVESLVTLTILVILSVGTVPLLTHLVRFYRLNLAKTEIQRDARTCLSTINRFLRQAQSATVTIDQATGQPPHSRITFTTQGGRTMTYYQQGNFLYQNVGTANTAISRNLRFLGFSYPRSDDPTIISVVVTMEKATYQGQTKALELSIEKVRVMN